MSATDYQTQGRVAVISMQTPPVNGLGHALRKGLLQGLDRAGADPPHRCLARDGTEGRKFRTGHPDLRAAAPQLFEQRGAAHGIEMRGDLVQQEQRGTASRRERRVRQRHCEQQCLLFSGRAGGGLHPFRGVEHVQIVARGAG